MNIKNWIWFEFDIEKLKYKNVKRNIEKFNKIINKLDFCLNLKLKFEFNLILKNTIIFF